MKRLAIFAVILLIPVAALAQTQEPTAADMADAGAAMMSNASMMMIRMRAQIAADQREIAALTKQLDDTKKAPSAPKP